MRLILAVIGDTEAQYIIWNFYTTNSSLSLSGNNAIYGTILAPAASVSKSSSSNLSGQIIAKSASLIQGYINYQPFSAQIADIFPSNIALPLESIELTAQLQNNTIALTWLAYNELNINGYQVESSIDGRNYTTIKSIESVGSGTNKYKTSVDAQTFNKSSVYFRIKALDKNGKIYYSKVAMINLTAVVSFQTWPNPVSECLNISIQADTKQTMRVQLFNTSSVIVEQQTVAINKGLNQVSLDGLAGLPSGTYFVKLIDKETGAVTVQKILK